jgi:hydroxymethylpyrimidine pyrophosphatase-like HAD family hydrolase
MKTPAPGKKYFFFDIDGTLTDDATHRIVPSAQETLQQLRQNGHYVAIATGRAHYKAVAFTNQIDIHNLVCAGGGCLVIDDQIIDNVPLDLAKAKTMLRHADEHGIGWILMLDDSDHVYMRDLRFLEQAGRRTELTTYHLDPSLDYEKLDAIYKIYMAVDSEDDRKYPWLKDLGSLRMGPGYRVFQYDKKKDGILRMMKYLQADVKDVVVFGDADNDMVMFDDRWFSIAMGNGTEALKKKADYVTDLNVNDGIMKACRKFGWI